MSDDQRVATMAEVKRVVREALEKLSVDPAMCISTEGGIAQTVLNSAADRALDTLDAPEAEPRLQPLTAPAQGLETVAWVWPRGTVSKYNAVATTDSSAHKCCGFEHREPLTSLAAAEAAIADAKAAGRREAFEEAARELDETGCRIRKLIELATVAVGKDGCSDLTVSADTWAMAAAKMRAKAT
jgi:hypothetical protein